MKTLHFVSILVLGAATTFACNDDGDRLEGVAGSAGSAGKSNAAGSAGKTTVAGTSNSSAGAGGGDAGSAGDGGVAGVAGSNEGGAAGAAGSNEGGEAGGGAGGETAGAGGAGGAGGEGGAGIQAPLEIIGSWDSGFGTETITATDWSSFNTDAILLYDNDANVVYTQIAANATYFPNKFTKIVYTEIQASSFYYCTIVYNADTFEAALADTSVADASDPDHKGCGSFDSAWTKLTRL